MPPTDGDAVPDLVVTTHDGRRRRLGELADGGRLVVFFYPRANTSGCSAEACHFRDLTAEFAALDATPVGISRDDLATQAAFAGEHGFGYPLVADTDGSVARAFGAKRPGPLWSKRQTVVLDRDLTVLGTIRSETEMHRHADEALALLRDA